MMHSIIARGYTRARCVIHYMYHPRATNILTGVGWMLLRIITLRLASEYTYTLASDAPVCTRSCRASSSTPRVSTKVLTHNQ